jgi:hypothetical protein
MKLALDDDGRLAERARDIAAFVMRLMRDIFRVRRPDGWRAGQPRLSRPRHQRQRLVADLDQVGGDGGSSGRFGQHNRHRLPHVGNLPVGQEEHPPVNRRVVTREFRQIGSRQHRRHARRSQRRRDIDAANQRARLARQDETGVQHPRQADVANVAFVSGQPRPGIRPLHAPANRPESFAHARFSLPHRGETATPHPQNRGVHYTVMRDA